MRYNYPDLQLAKGNRVQTKQRDGRTCAKQAEGEGNLPIGVICFRGIVEGFEKGDVERKPQ